MSANKTTGKSETESEVVWRAFQVVPYVSPDAAASGGNRAEREQLAVDNLRVCDQLYNLVHLIPCALGWLSVTGGSPQDLERMLRREHMNTVLVAEPACGRAIANVRTRALDPSLQYAIRFCCRPLNRALAELRTYAPSYAVNFARLAKAGMPNVPTEPSDAPSGTGTGAPTVAGPVSTVAGPTSAVAGTARVSSPVDHHPLTDPLTDHGTRAGSGSSAVAGPASVSGPVDHLLPTAQGTTRAAGAGSSAVAGSSEPPGGLHLVAAAVGAGKTDLCVVDADGAAHSVPSVPASASDPSVDTPNHVCSTYAQTQRSVVKALSHATGRLAVVDFTDPEAAIAYEAGRVRLELGKAADHALVGLAPTGGPVMGLAVDNEIVSPLYYTIEVTADAQRVIRLLQAA